MVEHLTRAASEMAAGLKGSPTLLALIIDPSATRPPSEIGPYAQDVVEILRGHARRTGSTVDPVIARSSLPDGDTPAAAVEALLAGLATLERGAEK